MDQVSLADVKVFYDREGNAREVLMDYETFQKIESFLREVAEQEDQSYFWTESWQSRIREAEADVKAGRIKEASAENLDSAMDWLDE